MRAHNAIINTLIRLTRFYLKSARGVCSMISKPFPLFAKERGPAGNYRIPSVITTKHGTIVACADARYFTARDNPNRIDKAICRSLDNGKTWEDMFVPVKEQGESMQFSSAAIDPCLLYDEDNDKIFMFYSHTPAGVGILNSKRGTGLDSEGRQIVVKDKKKYSVGKDGILYLKDKATQFRVDENGNVFDNGKKVGNIKTLEGGFTEYRTSYMYVCESVDDGVTWSKPVCISSQIKESYMCFIGCGPGVGIKIRNGAHKGRLVAPIYFTPRFWPLMECTACIYSDDNGKTWKRGGAAGENRKRLGIFKVGHKLIVDGERTSESQIIELPDGSLKVFVRNHASCRKVAVAISKDGGESWHDYHHIDVPQCICQISAINVKDGDKEATLLLNAANPKKREQGVIRLSYDYGETFPYAALIKDGEFVYSSMCQAKDGTICVLYEGSTQHETVDFITLTIDDIKKNNINK